MRVLNMLFFLSISGCINSQKVASLYLNVMTKNTEIPLQSTHVKVDIATSIAHVQLAQTYKNTRKIP